LEILAKVADEERNGKVIYGIVSGNDDKMFDLNPETGILSLRKQLDRERTAVYDLSLSATDDGYPNQLSSTVSVRLSVLDVNDNAPEFLPTSRVIKV
jgi:hypothetical protein